MTFLGLEARTDLPKVPYPTALDFFVFLSFAFIFATIIQFAVVHYFTKYGSGECYFSADELSSSSDDSDDDLNIHSIRISGKRSSNAHTINGGSESKLIEVIPLSLCSIPVTPVRKSSKSSWNDLPCFGKPEEPTVPFVASCSTSNVVITSTFVHAMITT